MRPFLPLAVLVLWGCLLTLERLIHPVAPGSPADMNSGPFFRFRSAGVDYYQFWIVGRARDQWNPENIYSMQDRQRMADLGREILNSSPRPSERLAVSVQFRKTTIETFGTPFLYAAINAFATGEYDRDYNRFMTFCLAALLVSIAALGWSLRYSWLESLLFAAAVLLWCDPVASDLRVGNVNQLQLAGVAAYLLLRCWLERGPFHKNHRMADVFSGLVLGLLVAFKPTLWVIPTLLTLAWIIDRRWHTLLTQGVAAVAAAGMAFAVGCRFLHSGSAWFDWIKALPDLDKVSDISVRIGNFSLAQVLRESIGGPAGEGVNVAPVLLIVVLAMAAIALRLTRWTRAGAPGAAEDGQFLFERDFLITALGCALSVVALKLVWLHYYILLIPLLLYVLRPGVAITGSRFLPIAERILGWLALGAIFGRPLAVLFGLGPPSHCMSLYMGGAWGLMLLGLAGLRLAGSSRNADSQNGSL